MLMTHKLICTFWASLPKYNFIHQLLLSLFPWSLFSTQEPEQSFYVSQIRLLLCTEEADDTGGELRWVNLLETLQRKYPWGRFFFFLLHLIQSKSHNFGSWLQIPLLSELICHLPSLLHWLCSCKLDYLLLLEGVFHTFNLEFSSSSFLRSLLS